MTTTITLLPDGGDRRTFSSPKSFRVFLGLQAEPDSDNQYRCMAWTASNKSNSACGYPLGKKKAPNIDVEIDRFCEAGFPSAEADECLWRIVFNSICSINRHRHNVVVGSTGSARPTQYQHLYNTWHGSLWEIYHQEHSGIQGPPLGVDAVPPPLHTTAEIWRERAMTATKKPPILKRALTASSTIHVSSTRLVGLFSRLSVNRPKLRRGKAKGGRKEEPNAVPEIPFRRHSENNAVSSASSISDTSDAFEPTEPPAAAVQPAAKDDTPVGPTTPIRPPLTRTEPPSEEVTQAKTAEDPYDDASLLVPSPDSINSGKAPSIFSNLEKDLVDTPLSGHSFGPPNPIAEPTNVPDEDCQRRHSRARANGSPVRKSRTRQPNFAHDMTQGVETTTKAYPNLILYYQSDVEKDEISRLQQKLQGRFRDVDVELKPRAPPKPRATERAAAPPVAGVQQPGRLQILPGPQGMVKNKKALGTLRNMINNLHHPISQSELNGGFVYGFMVTDDKLEACIKIGSAKSTTDRQQYISTKCDVELIPLFDAYMPCAPSRMESLVRDHLWESQRKLGCVCGVDHIEWHLIGLEEALESVLTWQEFSRCQPYETETACLGAVWDSITGKVLDRWDYMKHGSTDPTQWVEIFLRPVLRRMREAS
ncbi:hypothetical protein B0T14DRAFT_570383 [Immersiella caudata]|uniref:Uncharacterized protein n=1 Tax=Immersiella caudata TaxID=314043 RepID=A0AA39WFH7_9PEZI|nr:hypothetical protein B0T14DRAFT_570383 [Immersiella caudata]